MNGIDDSMNSTEKATPPRILFIEDDESCVMLVEKIFKYFKWSFKSFTDTSEALRASGGERFDIIFSDANMPGIDGFELAIAIRNDPSNPNRETPIIIVSGSDMDERMEEHLKSAAITEFISKPFSMEAFNEIVGRYVSPPSKK